MEITLRRVLIASDDQELRSPLARGLVTTLRGCAVESAGSLAAALESVTNRPPDAVIVCLPAPGPECAEVARILRASPHGAALVVIVVTQSGDADDWKRLEDAGVDHWVVDPFDVDALIQRLVRLSNRRRDEAA